ncbi:MAG TPA: TonB-dependent receptor [Bacteroidota bacterium]|nr:TonB-dependent receptor [Bacteroidota bacterium]
MKSATTALLLFLISSAASAQEQLVVDRDTVFFLSPVIVNPLQATKRETPATFSTLSSGEITDRYSVQDIPVLLSDLPSTTFYSENGNGIGYNYINIRGFDQRRLSVMINGVPQNDPEDHSVYWIDFPDLLASTGSIQVQRGAGSSFYGPPAIGGSVNLTTNPFSYRPGLTVESDFGFQQYADSSRALPLTTKKFSIAFQSGLVADRYMFYGRLGSIASGGYRINSWVDLSSYFLGAVRYDGNMTTRIHLFGGPITDGLSYGGLPKFVNGNPVLRRQNVNDWTLDSAGSGYASLDFRRPQETEYFSQPHAELINDWKLSTVLSLTNVLFYYTGSGYYDYDASWADTSMLRIGYRYGFPTTVNPTNTLVRAFVGNSQFGWLPHLEIDHGDGSLTAGAELRFHRSTHWGKISYAEQLPPGFDPDYHFYEYNGEKDIVSLYLHEIYHPAAPMSILADLQYVYNRYGIANEKYLGNDFSLPYHFLNPRLGMNYNFTDQLNAYVSAALTSREPTLRNLYAAEDSYFGATPQFAADTAGGKIRYDFSRPIAQPEQLIDLEAGAGYTTPILHLSGNVYWMEFTNELVEDGQLDIFGQPVTSNAERTRHVGLECEASCRPDPSLILGGNFTVSMNRLVHYRVLNDTGIATLDGNDVAGFPGILGNFRVDWSLGNLTSDINIKYVGWFYTDNFNTGENRNDAFTTVDGGLVLRRLTAGDFELSLRAEVHNLFNAYYFLSGTGGAFFPGAERNFLLGATLHL